MQFRVFALLVIFASLGIHIVKEGQAFPSIDNTASSDPGEYRYVAEYFFGIPHDPATYAPVFFETSWGMLLETVPLREIGVGSMYLLGQVIFGARVNVALPIVLKLLLIASSLLLFTACNKRHGAKVALIALALVMTSIAPWDFTEVLFSEAFVRVLFLLLLAAAIAWGAFDWRFLIVFLGIGLLLPHFKIQWLLLPALLTAAIALRLFWKQECKKAAVLCALALLIPASIIAVHMKWDYPQVTVGMGLHTFHKARSDAHQALCVRLFGIPAPQPFCDEFFRENTAGWIDFSNAWTTPEEIRSNVERLDREVIGYHLSKPAQLLSNFFMGAAYAKNVPYAERPWNLLLFPVDLLCWVIMLFGLRTPRTRLIALLGLCFWIVPAFGYLFQVYHDRYHVAMAGLPLVITFLILVELKNAMPILSGTRASISGTA